MIYGIWARIFSTAFLPRNRFLSKYAILSLTALQFLDHLSRSSINGF